MRIANNLGEITDHGFIFSVACPACTDLTNRVPDPTLSQHVTPNLDLTAIRGPT